MHLLYSLMHPAVSTPNTRPADLKAFTILPSLLEQLLTAMVWVVDSLESTQLPSLDQLIPMVIVVHKASLRVRICGVPT